MNVDQVISAHYAQGSLKQKIVDGIKAIRETSDASLIDILGAVDEFHMGGRTATKEITRALALKPDHNILDIGCGLGGAARYFHKVSGCHVHGIDLTPEYVEVANFLNEEVGMSEGIDVSVGSATELSFATGQFDRTSMLHVGMNIEDKAGLFESVSGALKKNGLFVVYDVMRMRDGNLNFPVAWAETTKTCFLQNPEMYEELLVQSGFEILETINQTELALYTFKSARKRYDQTEPPALGPHLVMGDDLSEKMANMVQALSIGVIAPIQMVARKL